MKKCELLVPAGGEKQLIAAVENGADAVYLGGKQFNARINAGNFSDEKLPEAVDFAHKRGVKVYVTMNTLIKNEEMQQAMAYAEYLYEIGVDALIIQDFGLGMLLRENLPELPLHLSTQGSVYDLRGVEAAYAMGYDRVVLARELSFDEIQQICRKTSAEIEVFVHGAMCICYSGQCQMSRSFGGRSGNRGQCAQPCRLPYMTLDEEGRRLHTFKYPLSPKDLCLIDHIGELAEAGVASLKIEGRMKSAEYVAVVTSIYRKYLDCYEAKGGYTVSEEDRETLLQIFNRGGFTEGYFCENPGKTLMSGNLPKHQGIRIGKVVKRVEGTSLVDVKLYQELSIGDGIEIHGKTLTGNVVTYKKPLKNGLVRIGDLRGEVSHGDPVFRITDKKLMEEAKKTYARKTYREGNYLRKTPVEMKFQCNEEGEICLEIKSALTEKAITVTGGSFPYIEGERTEEGRIQKALNKTGNTPFFVEKIFCREIDGRNIPISSINKLRRRGMEKLEAELVFRREPTDFPRIFSSPQIRRPSALEFCFTTWERFREYRIPSCLDELKVDKIALLPLVEYENYYDQFAEEQSIVPYITNISRGREDRFIEENFDRICEHCRKRGIYIGNLSWILPFRAAGIPVYGDSGLNVYNSYAEEALAQIGVRHCAESREAEQEGFGRRLLMISAHRPEGKWLIDRKKEQIELFNPAYSEQTMILENEREPDWEKIGTKLAETGGIVRVYL